jgi:type VI secretion system protein ImpK
MTTDDPFGLNDLGRTQVIRPRPGGIGPAPPAAERAAPVASGAPLPEGTPGRGPLVQAAHGLLLLAPRLKSANPPADPDSLLRRVEGELKRFEQRALALGADPRQVAAGNYVLCALLDDVVLNTPWGAHGIWKSRGLAATLHRDVAAGERFFELLRQYEREAERSRPILELMACCLALGFEGKFRLRAQPGESLAGLREELDAILARLRGPQPAELSPHWRGVEVAHRPLREVVPLWVVGTATLGLLALIYVALLLRLGAYADRLGPAVASLPPQGDVQIVRTGPAPKPRPKPPAGIGTCFTSAGRPVPPQLADSAQSLYIPLPSESLFRSASDVLDQGVTPLLACIGDQLDKQRGRILVVGHTDDRPIRSRRFPSNQALSEARAEAVRAVLAPRLQDSGRITTQGKADRAPVASNATEDGRAANRRVEIVLVR